MNPVILIFGVVIILIIILTFLLYTKYADNNVRKSVYGMKRYVTGESEIYKYLRQGAENYFEKALRTPGFNFDRPVVFNSALNRLEYGTFAGLPAAGLPAAGLPAAGLPAAGLPAAGLPAAGLPAAELPVVGLPTAGLPGTDDPNINTTSTDDVDIDIMDKNPILTDEEEKKEFELIGLKGTDLRDLSIAIGGQMAIEAAAKRIGKKIGPKISSKISSKVISKTAAGKLLKKATKPLSKVAKTISKKAMKLGAKALARIGSFIGRSVLGRVGSKIAASAIAKAAAKAAAKIAAGTIGKAAASAAAKAASKASMGPVGWIMLIYDATSITLDLTDAKGYSMIETYKAMRDEAYKMAKKNYEDMGMKWPYEVGPYFKDYEDAFRKYDEIRKDEIIKYIEGEGNEILRKLNIKDYNNMDKEEKIEALFLNLTELQLDEIYKLVNKETCAKLNGKINSEGECEYDNALDKERDKLVDIFLKPDLIEYTKKITEIYTDDSINEKEKEKRSDDLFSTMVDMDKAYEKADKVMCSKRNGVINSKGNCVYKDKKTCESHYTIENNFPVGTYTEWNPVTSKCMTANWQIKKLCKDNKLEYDVENGTCNVTRELCIEKGIEPIFDTKKKRMDCYIPTGQNIAEFAAGTTVYRAGKQASDLRRFEPCGWDEIEDGKFCNKKECPEDMEEAYGACYKLPGKDWVAGLGYVRKKCPPGFGGFDFITNTCKGGEIYGKGFGIGATCPPGYKNFGISCEPESLGRGLGRVGSVINDYTCPAGYPNKGALGCFKYFLGKRVPYIEKQKSHVPYSLSGGNAIPDPTNGKGKWEKCGLLYYPKCPPGYDAVGCNICRKSGPTLMGWDKMVCGKHKQGDSKAYAGKDKDKVVQFQRRGAFCYPPCAAGYRDDGLVCNSIEWKKVEKRRQTPKAKGRRKRKEIIAMSTK